MVGIIILDDKFQVVSYILYMFYWVSKIVMVV